MGRFGVELLLVGGAAFQSLGFIITYIVAVYEGHVFPYLPYISNTGGKVPESCIFSLVCSISALFYLIVIWIRFHHTHQYYSKGVTRIKWLNYAALFLALPTLLGLVIVGSFQDDFVPIVHTIGAQMTFVGGMAYMWLQTLISYRIYRVSLTNFTSRAVIVLRLSISLLATISYILTFALGAVSREMRSHGGILHPEIWSPDEVGFAAHVVSTISEWTMTFALLLFFLTYHPDFQRIGIQVTVTLRHQTHAGLTESTPLTL